MASAASGADASASTRSTVAEGANAPPSTSPTSGALASGGACACAAGASWASASAGCAVPVHSPASDCIQAHSRPAIEASKPRRRGNGPA
jgi:hypothetical protein